MKPILFNTEMVQAILEDRKTVTRRVCKEIANYKFSWGLDREPYIGDYRTFTKTSTGKWDWVTLKNQWLYDLQTKVDESKPYLLKPKYQVGDILYVRETHCPNYFDEFVSNKLKCAYKADWNPELIDGAVPEPKWKPSIHMKKELARIFLKVTEVRVERLQDITEGQAINEGVKLPSPKANYINSFIPLWDSTIKEKELDKYGWDANPWVWVIEFEKFDR